MTVNHSRYPAGRWTLWLAAIITAALFMLPALKLDAAELKVKGSLKTQTSCKITLTKKKGITHWKIRMAKESTGGSEKYKTIKTLKVSTKSYTIKNLKKNTNYRFELVGCKKKNGKLTGVIYDYDNCYTGMSNVAWDDYASSDAPCSPKLITLWGSCYNDGLPIKGLEIYRKVKGASKWTKIATLKKKSFSYKDKKVEAGKTYYYRFRSYGTYKKKKLYSVYSEKLCLSAVNQKGEFTSQVISRDKDEIVLKMDSKQYNGTLCLKSRRDVEIGKDRDQLDNWEGIPLDISEISEDGKNWKALGEKDEMELEGGKSIYVRFKASPDSDGKPRDVDLSNTELKLIGTDELSYNGLPCYFYMTLGGDGEAWMNMEMIH